MASNSKSGLTKEERESFLRERGFAPLRTGKGSHETWENPELKALARTHPVAPPSNLLTNSEQKPWEITVCDNPAKGTWLSMAKYADWCKNEIADIKARDMQARQRAETCRQFRSSVEQVCQWRKSVKHWLKSGLKVTEAPTPPVNWHDFQAIKARKNQLSPH